MPVTLDAVTVSVGGIPAAISYVSPNQLNVLLPAGLSAGPQPVIVTNQLGTSSVAQLICSAIAPALFRLQANGGRYVAARVHNADGSSRLAAPDALYGNSGSAGAVHAGEIVSLALTGLGATKPLPSTDSVFTGAYDALNSAAVLVGGQTAQVLFAGRVSPGLDQIDVVVPSLPDGDYPVDVTVAGQHAQTEVYLSVGDAINVSLPGLYNRIAKANNSTVFLGDSISLTNQDYVNEPWPSQVWIRSDAEVLKSGDAGVPGNTTAMMLARIEDVLAIHPANCVILGGTNDLSSVDPATIVAHLDEIAGTLQAAGIRPILALVPPRDGAVGLVQALNRAIQNYADGKNLKAVDFYSVLADPATGSYAAGNSVDGIHPSDRGAQLMAEQFLAQTQRLFIPVASFLPSAGVVDGNLLADPAGTLNRSPASLENGWVRMSGSGSANTIQDDRGFAWHAITAAGTDAFQIGRLYLSAGAGTFTPGDRMAFVTRFKADLSQAAPGSSYSVTMQFVNGAQQVLAFVDNWTQTVAEHKIFHEFTVPQGTTFINVYAQVQGVGADLQIAQTGLYNLSRPAIAQ